ncbi:MAG: TRAP transporter small permease subunit [Spirochaetales bacterium]|nr:TRAP transporter small permease subunit [Spirochaetales bacterium]
MNKELMTKKTISLSKITQKIEDSILIVLTVALVIFAILQLVLSLVGMGITWFDSLLKYLVLWIGMFAASVATTNRKHIKIDIVGHWTKGRIKTALNLAINFFAAVICITLFILSIIYIVTIEYPSTDPAPFLNIPRWVLILCIPISFCLMSIKFSIYSVTGIRSLVRNEEYPKEAQLNETQLSEAK